MAEFRGVGVALVTPFTSDGDVDYNALKCLLEHTAKGGVSYYVAHGTTGESVTTTAEEKQQILEYIQANRPNNLPVVYGLGGSDTAALLKKMKAAELKDVSAILSVCPSYSLPTQEGMYQHFIRLADAAPAPILLYNVPSRTGRNLEAETTLRLAEHENIVGIKEASRDLVQCMEIAKGMPKGFQLISGDDLLTLPTISVGGVGVISVMANVIPSVFCRMVSKALEGNYAEAQQALYRLLEINPLLYKEGNPAGIKQALKEMNICESFVRLPLIQASDELSSLLRSQLAKLTN